MTIHIKLLTGKCIALPEKCSNQHGYHCPNCGRSDQISILAQHSTWLKPNGNEITEELDWENDSRAWCLEDECRWEGNVSLLKTVAIDNTTLLYQGEQVTACSNHYPCFDMHNNPIMVGDTIRYQYCCGPYGQTRVKECVVTEAHWPYGVHNNAAVWYTGDGYMIGYHDHADHDHGHESWIKIIRTKAVDL